MSGRDDEQQALPTIDEREAAQSAGPGLERERAALVFYHREGTQAVELAEGGSVVVGRAFPADVTIGDPSLSRMHARFTWVGGTLTVEDLESTNGTLVGGQRVARATITTGDEILLGSVGASVSIMAPHPAARQGVESYDRLHARLREEVVRAEAFKRAVSLIMLRTRGKQHHIAHLGQRVQERLRAVDHAGVYDGTSMLLLLPELAAEPARALAAALCESEAVDGLFAGVASFPSAATSAEELLARARDACMRATAREPVRVAETTHDAEPRDGTSVVVACPAMRELYRLAGQVAPRNVPVLVLGETGVGKEVLVGAIHGASGRKGALRVINCAAIPKELTESILFGHERGAFTGADRRRRGLFEEAHGGTVFLDEVGELPVGVQASLLRVLQDKRITRVGGGEELGVDVRVVAATHRDLAAMVQAGAFREDLFYRLNAVTLEVPPLRERAAEVVPLARMFLDQVRREWGTDTQEISDDALALLRAYTWPGNVRQLRNVIERAVAIGGGLVITADDLPAEIREYEGRVVAPSRQPPASEGVAAEDGIPLRERLRHIERNAIRDAMQSAGGNVTRAAELLGMPQRTLFRKVKEYGIGGSEVE